MQEIVENKEEFMRKEIEYEEFFPEGEIKRVPDFLPSPEELAAMEKKQKVTINLDRETVDFFKEQAEKYDVSYQAMIRNALTSFAKNMENLHS